jgi:hypothetical protein
MAVDLSPSHSTPPPHSTINFIQATNQWKSFNPSYPSFFLQFEEKNFVIKAEKILKPFILSSYGEGEGASNYS